MQWPLSFMSKGNQSPYWTSPLGIDALLVNTPEVIQVKLVEGMWSPANIMHDGLNEHPSLQNNEKKNQKKKPGI